MAGYRPEGGHGRAVAGTNTEREPTCVLHESFSYHNKFMTWPIVEGRIFMRGHDGVYCYDLRAK